jgi:hypothetical protein
MIDLLLRAAFPLAGLVALWAIAISIAQFDRR